MHSVFKFRFTFQIWVFFVWIQTSWCQRSVTNRDHFKKCNMETGVCFLCYHVYLHYKPRYNRRNHFWRCLQTTGDFNSPERKVIQHFLQKSAIFQSSIQAAIVMTSRKLDHVTKTRATREGPAASSKVEAISTVNTKQNKSANIILHFKQLLFCWSLKKSGH